MKSEVIVLGIILSPLIMLILLMAITSEPSTTCVDGTTFVKLENQYWEVKKPCQNLP